MTNFQFKSQRRPLLMLGVLLVALTVLTACSSLSLPPLTAPPVAEDAASAPAATGEAAEEAGAGAAPTAAEPATADVATGVHKGVPVGFTAEGFPFRGAPDAPITIREYSDFECPFCVRHFVLTEPALLDAYLSTGQVRMIFRDFPIASIHPNAPAAHVAALCIGEQGAEKYWEMHDKIFQTQSEWSNAIDPNPVFARLAGEIGADVDAMNVCITAGEKRALIAASINEGQVAGVTGTPSFDIAWAGGEVSYLMEAARPFEEFAANIDALLAGEMPPIAAELAQAEAEAEAAQQTPFWATPDGWQPDPDRPGFNMAGDQYRGNPDAKVTVVEFSDIQCPACRSFVINSQDILKEQFVDTDKVLWIFKHFPLNIHPQAPAAGIASECAAEQGAFWDMHDTLFETVEEWAIEDPNPVFMEIAGRIGLDVPAFEVCLSDPAMADRVQSDMIDGAQFIRYTPSFIVLYNGTGRIIEGALPASDFTNALNEFISEAGATN
jgi:protein-disulfide isomerase